MFNKFNFSTPSRLYFILIQIILLLEAFLAIGMDWNELANASQANSSSGKSSWSPGAYKKLFENMAANMEMQNEYVPNLRRRMYATTLSSCREQVVNSTVAFHSWSTPRYELLCLLDSDTVFD